MGVTGAPGVGKTTYAVGLVAASTEPAAYVPMDGFHLADVTLAALGRLDRKGAPDTFDAGGYAALLPACAQTEDVVYAPGFERDLEQPIAGAMAVPREAALIVTEGNYLLLDRPEWRAVRAQLDEVVFLVTDDEVRRPDWSRGTCSSASPRTRPRRGWRGWTRPTPRWSRRRWTGRIAWSRSAEVGGRRPGWGWWSRSNSTNLVEKRALAILRSSWLSRGLFAVVLAALAAPVVLLPGGGPEAQAGITPVAATAARDKGRPNIVFVLMDDFSLELLATMPQAQRMRPRERRTATPYVVDSLCCPSRAAIFTGRPPHQTGVLTNTPNDPEHPIGGYEAFARYGNAEKTFNVALHGGGYTTGFVGKYMNGYEKTHQHNGKHFAAGEGARAGTSSRRSSAAATTGGASGAPAWTATG